MKRKKQEIPGTVRETKKVTKTPAHFTRLQRVEEREERRDTLQKRDWKKVTNYDVHVTITCEESDRAPVVQSSFAKRHR